METTLHRQLKELYAQGDARTEVSLDRYRIDVVTDERLVEIQHGSLGAIRDKVARLCRRHQVLVVKPLIVAKQLVKRKREGGPIVDRRRSPLRGSVLDLFDDLIHFTRVFPHPNLTLDVVLVETEEWRFPRRRSDRRSWRKEYVVEDKHLLEIRARHRLQTPADLLQLVNARLPKTFDTKVLAEQLGIERWVAQRIAYCLRETGAIQQIGKRGNTLLYTSMCSKRAAA